MIEVKSIAKSYGPVHAVREVSFRASDGAITTLLGGNGSGKTTSLRAIAGLIALDQGSVVVDGIPVAEQPRRAQHRLGIFPESFGLYPRLTTREHLAYFAGLHGLRGVELRQAVELVIERLQLQDIVDRRTEGFSQGQKMRVALGRALVHKPANLVLDEPTRGLDVFNVRLLRRVLREARAGGSCILLSSHVMADVETLSDRVVVIHEGRTTAEGTPQQLISETGKPNLEEAFVALTGMREVA